MYRNCGVYFSGFDGTLFREILVAEWGRPECSLAPDVLGGSALAWTFGMHK